MIDVFANSAKFEIHLLQISKAVIKSIDALVPESFTLFQKLGWFIKSSGENKRLINSTWEV